MTLDLAFKRIVLLTNVSFQKASGMKRELGSLILKVDKNAQCKILHYGRNKCQLVARSVMAAEIHALVIGFDLAFFVKDLFEKILGVKMRIEAMINRI